MSIINPKVIHAPLEISGQVGLICQYLEREGCSVIGFNYFDSYLKYKRVFHTESYELIKGLESFIKYFDIFHFHNSYSIIEDHRDIELIKKAGKKLVMHHRGNDVRFPSLATKGRGYYNPYVNTNCSLKEKDIHRNLQLFADGVDAAIVQDYELFYYVIEYYEGCKKPVYVLPRLIDTKSIEPIYPRASKKPFVIHAPTNRQFKGSDIIEAVIKQLSKEVSMEYVNIEGISHHMAFEMYQRADIIIDQVLCGSYGNLSVEAMALGKPVICFIRPDLVKTYPPSLPIVSANPDNLYDQLKSLLLDTDAWNSLGRAGRRYVEENHEASKIIKQLISIYSRLYKL